jgi:hypothetical protein
MLALFVAAASMTGCGQEAVHFNNGLTKLETRVEAPLKALMMHFKAFAESSNFDAAKAEADFTQTLEAIDGVVKEVQATPVIGATLAKEFHTAYLAYYASIREAVTTDVRAGLDVLKDPATSDREKATAWVPHGTKVRDKLQAAMAALLSVQRQFAAAHNMTLK